MCHNMEYFLSFLEGIITFISPCLLPMLPVYISYFAGQDSQADKNRAVVNAAGFILGFTLVFVSLGAFAGSIGRFLQEYSTAVNIVGGIIVLLFGLNFMEVVRLPFLNSSKGINLQGRQPGFFSSVLFGLVFSVSWTPCVGAFLGSALMLAAQGGESMRGIIMLLCFSMGLGIPFLISAIMIEQLKSTFLWIKKHYRGIQLVCGGMLVVVGIMMMTGMMGYLMGFLSL